MRETPRSYAGYWLRILTILAIISLTYTLLAAIAFCTHLAMQTIMAYAGLPQDPQSWVNSLIILAYSIIGIAFLPVAVIQFWNALALPDYM